MNALTLGLSITDLLKLTPEGLNRVMEIKKDQRIDDLKIQRKFVTDIINTQISKKSDKLTYEKYLPLEGKKQSNPNPQEWIEEVKDKML